MANSQPPLTLRSFDIANVTEAVGAVLLIVIPFDTHAVLHDAMRTIYAVSSRMRKIRAERTAATNNYKLIFIRVLHSTVGNIRLCNCGTSSLLLLLLLLLLWRRRRYLLRLLCWLLLLLSRRRRWWLLLLHHVRVAWLRHAHRSRHLTCLLVRKHSTRNLSA